MQNTRVLFSTAAFNLPRDCQKPLAGYRGYLALAFVAISCLLSLLEIRRLRHYYNHDRPNQTLDGRTPIEEAPN